MQSRDKWTTSWPTHRLQLLKLDKQSSGLINRPILAMD